MADEDSCGSPVDVGNRRVVAETGAYLGRPQIRALATMGRVDFCCPCWRLVETVIRETNRGRNLLMLRMLIVLPLCFARHLLIQIQFC